MKIILTLLALAFITITLYADKNWIKIEPINKTQTSKSNTKIDVDLSQIEPINKIIKNAIVIKQLIDNSKKEKPTTNDKNWFVFNTKESK